MLFVCRLVSWFSGREQVAMWRSSQAARRRTRVLRMIGKTIRESCHDQRKNTRKRATRNAGSSPTRAHLQGNGKQWAESVTSRLRLIEVTITPKSEEPEKKEARVVLETVVEEGAIVSSLSTGLCPRSLCRCGEWRLRGDTCQRVCSPLRFGDPVLE